MKLSSMFDTADREIILRGTLIVVVALVLVALAGAAVRLFRLISGV